jgi:hypothetical protein
MFGFAAFAVSAFAALGSVSSANVSETTTLTEAITTQSSLVGAVSETTTLTDVNTVAWNALATTAESLTVVDSITVIRAVNVSVPETVTLTDAASSNASFLATTAESFALYLTGPVAENSYFGATPFAAIPFAGVSNFTGKTYEQIVATLTTNQTVTESLTLTATQSAYVNFAPQIIEAVLTTDATTATEIMFVTTAESFYAADTLIQRGWIKINDNQTGAWSSINNNVTVTWTSIDDTENPNWVPINDNQG